MIYLIIMISMMQNFDLQKEFDGESLLELDSDTFFPYPNCMTPVVSTHGDKRFSVSMKYRNNYIVDNKVYNNNSCVHESNLESLVISNFNRFDTDFSKTEALFSHRESNIEVHVYDELELSQLLNYFLIYKRKSGSTVYLSGLVVSDKISERYDETCSNLTSFARINNFEKMLQNIKSSILCSSE